MGRKSRVKGKVFERKIATKLREKWPDLAHLVRRADQGHGAKNSDVCGIPCLWIECQDAQNPTPDLKLEQALRDLEEARLDKLVVFPVAVTHRLGARSIQATLQWKDFVLLNAYALGECYGVEVSLEARVVTLDFDDFLDLADRARPWEPKSWDTPEMKAHKEAALVAA